MPELAQWALGLGIMGAIFAVIIWDHRYTKREDRARAEREKAESDWWWV